MADFSFHSYSHNRSALRGHHTTPQASPRPSPSPGPRRQSRRPPSSPTSPSNPDTSWQSEVSWQFEPTGWREASGGFGAALSPWTPATSISRSPAVFVRGSARDYYLSRTSNPLYERSPNAGRLELYSYISNGNLRSHDISRLNDASMSTAFPNANGIGGRRGRRRYRSTRAGIGTPLASKDELSMVDYSAAAPEMAGHAPSHQHRPSSHLADLDQGSNHHRRHSPEFTGAMHTMNHNQHHGAEDISFSHELHGSYPKKTNDHDWHLPRHELNNNKNSMNYNHAHDDRYSDDEHDDGDDEEDDEEEEEESTRPPVGLFSLFKYSTKWDTVLIFFGCVGALINGGSLPWYSYLFGNFVNKIAKESIDDKTQMMKDVEKICLYMAWLAGIVLIGAFMGKN